MKNYLGNLIARHMNTAEVLTPRLASRFEAQSNVLQSDALEMEAGAMEVAESFAGDAVAVATISDPSFVAPVSPVNAPEGERRIENNAARPSRITEEVFGSNGSPAVLPELPHPEVVTSDQAERATAARVTTLKATAAETSSVAANDPFQESIVPGTTSARPVVSVSGVSAVSGVPSVNQIHSDTASGAEVAERMSMKSVVATQPITATQPVAASEHVGTTQRVATQPFATQPVATAQPIATTQIETAGEHVIAREVVHTREPFTVPDVAEPSKSTAPARSNQTTRQPVPVELQPSAPRIKTETGQHTLIPGAKSKTLATHLSHLENSQDIAQPQPPKPRPSVEVERSSRDPLPAVVVAEPHAESRAVNAGRENQFSPKQPERSRDETTPPPRARTLETSLARSPRNDPMNARTMSPYDVEPVDSGPTINVTIGRIEVRAATSEVRPQKQRREQQVLSLDEYLSQRSAGGR